MERLYLRFAYITGAIMAIYVTVVVLIMLGVRQPIIVYPIGFFVAYLLIQNLKERFKGKENEKGKTILLLAITFLIVTILFAVGPAFIITL